MSTVLALFLFTSASMQASTGSISGRARDQSRTPVPGVVVRLNSPEGTEVERTAADEGGRFAFVNVASDSYFIVIEDDDHEKFRQSVEVGSGQDVRVDVDLKRLLPQIAESVVVYAAASRTAASSSTFRQEEFALREIETPGDLLRVVPGLVVAQHAGGGKADQYLIRGFDADHGTDLALYFEGVPVNMVSHAHGQGYADLHFLIPETLDAIEVYKGPYFAEYGNFATAGVSQFRLRERFDKPFLRLQGGNFDSARLVAGFSPTINRAKGFVALEGYRTDGPFANPQNLHRWNLATRWSFPLGTTQQLTTVFTAYEGNWNASGQIPLREVRDGRLDRFGSIDPTEGGRSSRYNFSLAHTKQWQRQVIKSQFYSVDYDLDLFSNFTFSLRDPLHGDGILQKDDRALFGGHFQYYNAHDLFGSSGLMTLGIDYRQDHADVGLFNQTKRRPLSTTVSSNILERNVGIYLQEEFSLGQRLKAILGLRHDRFHFNVRDLTTSGLEGNQANSITLPKISLEWFPSSEHHFRIFMNYGRGFHSNDARSTLANALSRALAAASGYEIGMMQRFGRLEMNFAYWLLDLDGELVWVGDEGRTELSGPTRRHGPELEMHYHVNEHLTADFDFTHSTGFFRGSRNRIPRAPRLTFAGGLTLNHPKGLSASLRVRGTDDFPLNDDSSFQGDGYAIAELNLRYRLTPRWDLIGSFENLFNADYKEAQTFFESRLPFERAPAGDNHFTPGNPFTFRVGLQFNFD